LLVSPMLCLLRRMTTTACRLVFVINGVLSAGDGRKATALRGEKLPCCRCFLSHGTSGDIATLLAGVTPPYLSPVSWISRTRTAYFHGAYALLAAASNACCLRVLFPTNNCRRERDGRRPAGSRCRSAAPLRTSLLFRFLFWANVARVAVSAGISTISITAVFSVMLCCILNQYPYNASILVSVLVHRAVRFNVRHIISSFTMLCGGACHL